MSTIKPALTALLFVGLLARVAPADVPFACNPGAFTPAERATHAALSRRVLAAVLERKELPDGYAFRLPVDAMASAARWAVLERRCCPFFDFDLELARADGPLWLHVTGARGVKAFIREEFGLDDAPGR